MRFVLVDRYIAGCFGKFVLSTDDVINSFTDKWDSFILPLLSTHMALTFRSAGIEKFAEPARSQD